MEPKKILKEIRLLKAQANNLQTEAEAINNALTVLEKELSDSGVSGSSKQGKAAKLEAIANEAVLKRRGRRTKKAAQ